MGLSNVAVQYLQYPTHILFKSAKPIPALLTGLSPPPPLPAFHLRSRKLGGL